LNSRNPTEEEELPGPIDYFANTCLSALKNCCIAEAEIEVCGRSSEIQVKRMVCLLPQHFFLAEIEDTQRMRDS